MRQRGWPPYPDSLNRNQTNPTQTKPNQTKPKPTIPVPFDTANRPPGAHDNISYVVLCASVTLCFIIRVVARTVRPGRRNAVDQTVNESSKAGDQA
jgi:hypothetical protein